MLVMGAVQFAQFIVCNTGMFLQVVFGWEALYRFGAAPGRLCNALK